MDRDSLLADEQVQTQIYGGWIHAFGLYQPRWQMRRHINSGWSQAVIMAKRKSEGIVAGFGRIIAAHLAPTLQYNQEYVITHVPAEESRELFLFLDFKRCATEALASAIYEHLKDHTKILLAGVLAQIKQKPRKQHQCTSDAERAANVRGVYAVTNSDIISGKSVILVDDVLTSGATMRECADVLKSAGAINVMGIALARTERARAPSYALSDGGWPGGDAA